MAWPRERSSASGWSSAGRSPGASSPKSSSSMPSSSIWRASTSTRVAVYVQVVVAALLDVMEVVELRQHHAKQPQAIGQVDAGHGAGRGDQALELAEHALHRSLRHARGGVAGELLGGPIRGEAQLGGQARQPQRAQRIRLVGLAREDPEHAGVEVGAPSLGVDHRAARHRARHRVHAEVAAREVRLDGLALERGHVVGQARAAVERAPRAEALRQAEPGPRNVRASARAAVSG